MNFIHIYLLFIIAADDQMLLSDCGIQTGDLVIAEEHSPNAATTSAAAAAAAASAATTPSKTSCN